MLLSLRKNGLTSLFKEVRVFKVFVKVRDGETTIKIKCSVLSGRGPYPLNLGGGGISPLKLCGMGFQGS